MSKSFVDGSKTHQILNYRNKFVYLLSFPHPPTKTYVVSLRLWLARHSQHKTKAEIQVNIPSIIWNVKSTYHILLSEGFPCILFNRCCLARVILPENLKTICMGFHSLQDSRYLFSFLLRNTCSKVHEENITFLVLRGQNNSNNDYISSHNNHSSWNKGKSACE